MYSNNLEGRQGSDLIQYSTPWEYELTNKQTSGNLGVAYGRVGYDSGSTLEKLPRTTLDIHKHRHRNRGVGGCSMFEAPTFG